MSKEHLRERRARRRLVEKQFGTDYGPALTPQQKLTIKDNLKAEIERLGGCPYGWTTVLNLILFDFYNRRTGQCFPSHKTIAAAARCSVRTVQRALNWARDNGLIHWAHGLVRGGWRVLRTSNRYAFAAWLAITLPICNMRPLRTNCQISRRPSTYYLNKGRSLADIDLAARAFKFPPAPHTLFPT